MDLKVGLVGVSGYSGRELLLLLLSHPHARVTYVSANNSSGPVSDIWPELTGRTKLICEKYDPVEAKAKCDLVFLAVPHTVAMTIAPDLLKAGVRVIDLSGDYRLKKSKLYQKWYGQPHSDHKHLRRAVYGLPELHKESIRKAALIANPGCYPTAAILALAPLVSTQSDLIQNVIIDAKSGSSGAGRKANIPLSASEVHGNFRAYKILSHQHQPEIDLYLNQLGMPGTAHFVPHLLPIKRGIFETIYVTFSGRLQTHKLHKLYTRFYKTEPFVRIRPRNQLAELQFVTHTNYCDVGLVWDDKKKLLVITAAIDNLLKGASGQAVQNMNLMNNIEETAGLL